jgi:hypothetical protein
MNTNSNRDKTMTTCPRCLGKGHVTFEDIKRLGREEQWGEGKCAYCNGKGSVEKEKVLRVDPSDLSITLREGEIKEVSDFPKTFASFITFFKKRVCPHFIFRGVSDYSYGLKSKVARSFEKLGIVNEQEFLIKEETLIEIFKSKAVSHVGMQQLSEWQWIVLAQHYGLSTRILDWTENPLIALYFACFQNIDKDGAIYFWHFTEALHLSDHTPLHPKESGFFIPPYLTNRIIAQSSVFSITVDPWKELQDDLVGEIHKGRITKKFKQEMRNLLPRFGISKRSIFSDLDAYATDLDEIFSTKKCFGNKSFNIRHNK